MRRSYWLETLGCPKNQVDSDKLSGWLDAEGLMPAEGPDAADIVVVNTCAFVEEARQESIDTILALAEGRRPGARLVVTGCLAERSGPEVARALPEVDEVVGFGVPVALGPPRRRSGAPDEQPGAPALDLLNLPRPAAARPWAYVKVAEGCDRRCGFCAIPSFRGPQRSRTNASVLEEVRRLAEGGVREVVLVAQDLASFGRDQGRGQRRLVSLVREVAQVVPRVRLLYLYPADLTDELIDTICDTGVPYFDLSLQHASGRLLRRMRRYGDARRFLERIERIRALEPEAALRTNIIVGYPGETEADHDELLAFLEAAELDWCGFFPYSPEEGTYALGLDGAVPGGLVAERLDEASEVQDRITAARRDELIGREVEVLVDEPGVGRTHREAPEIDGVVTIEGAGAAPGTFATVRIDHALGPDLHGELVGG